MCACRVCFQGLTCHESEILCQARPDTAVHRVSHYISLAADNTILLIHKTHTICINTTPLYSGAPSKSLYHSLLIPLMRVYVCMILRMYVYVCFIPRCMCMCVWSRWCMCMCVWSCGCVCIYTCIYAYIYIHIHAFDPQHLWNNALPLHAYIRTYM